MIRRSATVSSHDAPTNRRTSPRTGSTDSGAVYAKLPAAPRNASPVPHLTKFSLYHF